jgi:hypothetical protein
MPATTVAANAARNNLFSICIFSLSLLVVESPHYTKNYGRFE